MNIDYNTYRIGYGKKTEYYRFAHMGFDIETTTQYTRKGDEVTDIKACMYIWSLCINGTVYRGRTWESALNLFQSIADSLNLKRRFKTIIFIHNQSFEFAFMGRLLEERGLLKSIFAKDSRKPLRIELTNGIVFLDTYFITNSSLEKMAQDFCTTKKMVGDLDYNVQRHFNTPLTDKEYRYTDNDVIILSEYAQYYESEYLSKNFMPLTSTSIVRHILKSNFKSEDKSYKNMIHKAIYKCYPTQKEYDSLMHLFSGGFVHANAHNVSLVCEMVDSFDEKSAYPYVMLSKYFPMSPFRNIIHIDVDTMYKYMRKYCCHFRLELKNVKCKNGITTISSSKCLALLKPIIDNGRIYSCESMVHDFTELDFEIFEKFYDFEIAKIGFFRIAKRGKLPHYLRITVAMLFIKKQYLSIQIENESNPDKKRELEIEYNNTKARLNSCYGMCVTKLVTCEHLFIDGEWKPRDYTQEEINTTFYKQRTQSILLPQWGVWITSWARFLLLSMVFKISQLDNGNGYMLYIYSDTDSIKCFHDERIIKLIEEYNEQVMKDNEIFCKELNVSRETFMKLGTFEKENKVPYTRFKTLGAKRYIYEYNGECKATIAGLPKKALPTICKEKNIDMFDLFNNKMNISYTDSTKLTTHYLDEPFDMVVDDGNTVEHLHVPSAVALIPTTFKMSLTNDFVLFYTNLQEGLEIVYED